MRSCEEGDASQRAMPSAQLRIMWNLAFDRIVYRSDIIHIEGDESMRKRIG